MKYKIDISPLVDYFVVAVRDKDTFELKDTFTLNETGADMLRLFCLDKNITEVAKEIATLYDAPLDYVAKDVHKFADSLRKKGVI